MDGRGQRGEWRRCDGEGFRTHSLDGSAQDHHPQDPCAQVDDACEIVRHEGARIERYEEAGQHWDGPQNDCAKACCPQAFYYDAPRSFASGRRDKYDARRR